MPGTTTHLVARALGCIPRDTCGPWLEHWAVSLAILAAPRLVSLSILEAEVSGEEEEVSHGCLSLSARSFRGLNARALVTPLRM